MHFVPKKFQLFAASLLQHSIRKCQWGAQLYKCIHLFLYFGKQTKLIKAAKSLLDVNHLQMYP